MAGTAIIPMVLEIAQILNAFHRSISLLVLTMTPKRTDLSERMRPVNIAIMGKRIHAIALLGSASIARERKRFGNFILPLTLEIV